jgi:hypothetical protein
MTFSGERALHCDIRIHDSKKLSNITKQRQWWPFGNGCQNAYIKDKNP